jgi:hypothetical protein
MLQLDAALDLIARLEGALLGKDAPTGRREAHTVPEQKAVIRRLGHCNVDAQRAKE